MRVAALVAVAAAVRPSALDHDHVELHQTARRVVHYTSRVRFCNAYVPDGDKGAVNMYLVRSGANASNPEKKKINEQPIPFPSCVEDDRVLLMEGDRFVITGADNKDEEMAEFVVEDFNKSDDPLLMLVLSRKSPSSREPHFVSHQYARLKNSQIAAMNLFLPGSEGQSMKIQRVVKNEKENVRYEEVLKPNTVMAFDPGMDYEIVLTDANSQETAKAEFTAKAGEDYLALAVGMSDSKSFGKPQLLFFPSGAVGHMLGFVAVLVAVFSL